LDAARAAERDFLQKNSLPLRSLHERRSTILGRKNQYKG
jgi:hypothetical protein